MKSPQLLPSALEKTYTTSDFLRRVGLLREYYELVFFSKEYETVTISDFLKSKGIDSHDCAVILAWQEGLKPTCTKDNFYQILEDFHLEVSKFPVLTMGLAFWPLPEQTRLLGLWVRKNVSPLALINLQQDRKLMGGCSLIWNGQLADFSIRQAMLKSNPLIVDLLRKYTHE